jgi:hypothetical protein
MPGRVQLGRVRRDRPLTVEAEARDPGDAGAGTETDECAVASSDDGASQSSGRCRTNSATPC